jgi:hypothetical protein
MTHSARYRQRDQKECREESERCHPASPRNRKAQASRQGSRFATAEASARDGAERDRGDLSERPADNDDDRDGGQRDRRPHAIGREGSRHAPDGLRDNGDGH